MSKVVGTVVLTEKEVKRIIEKHIQMLFGVYYDIKIHTQDNISIPEITIAVWDNDN
jgi:hypothetical protein